MPTVLVLLAVLFAPDGSATAKASTMPDIKTCEQYAQLLHNQIESLDPPMGKLQTFCVDVFSDSRGALRLIPKEPS